MLVDDRIPCTWDGQFWQPIFAKPMKHEKQVTLMLFNLQSQSTLSKGHVVQLGCRVVHGDWENGLLRWRVTVLSM